MKDKPIYRWPLFGVLLSSGELLRTDVGLPRLFHIEALAKDVALDCFPRETVVQITLELTKENNNG